MAEISAEIQKRIAELSDRGDTLAEEGNDVGAVEKYLAAWDLLPEPKTEWEEATWILASIGDSNFHTEDYKVGRNNFVSALKCKGAIGNPFLHLRLGQCHFQLGDHEKAAEELGRASMADGLEVFEDEDPIYLEFLKTVAEEPPEDWRGIQS